MNLRSSEIIDPALEGHYAFYPFVEQITTQEHHHDFYEIFLIVDGSIYHHINGECVLLTQGTLVFIRPDDAHYFRRHADQNCELINLAFLSHTLHDLAAYFDLSTQHAPLLTAPQPPLALLTAAETSQLAADLKTWGRTLYRDKTRARLALRALLAQMIANFFVARAEEYADDVPAWLVEVCQQMQHKAYVVEGRSALMRLANRTPEYVGRAFKTHLGVTPSQYINRLRLDYASDLLLHTDRTVTEICYDVGFNNLSHFYHLFKARWDCSPLHFRKTNRQVIIP